MGASKTHQYSAREIHTAKIANALGHPARIRIMNILKTQPFTRNVDLVDELELVQSTVHKHLRKLYAAGLIEIEFYPNCYYIRSSNAVSESLVEHYDLI
jgi:DNA-binding transcriptional ArsR family regulator